MMCVINEKHSLGKVFCTELDYKLLRQRGCYGGKQPNMGEFMGLWIGRRVQSVLLPIDLDHRLVYRNVIRTRIAGGL